MSCIVKGIPVSWCAYSKSTTAENKLHLMNGKKISRGGRRFVQVWKVLELTVEIFKRLEDKCGKVCKSSGGASSENSPGPGKVLKMFARS